MTNEPTDEALENLFVEETGFDIDDFPAAIFGFARAVLAKWVSQLRRQSQWLGSTRGRAPKYDAYGKHGIPLYTAPQPVARETLTDAQIAEMMRDTWGCASIAPRHALAFARAVERAHGTKGGQHGTE